MLFVTLLVLMAILTTTIFLAFRMSQRYKQAAQEGKDLFRLSAEAQEAERRRIAREIHDAILPDIRAYVVTASDARAEESLGPVLKNLRALCTELMPPDFERLHFADVIVALSETLKARSGIECRLSLMDTLETGNAVDTLLSPDRRLHLFRIVQEALNNIAHHSQAKNAFITMRIENNTLHMVVQDDGIGLSGDSVAEPGMGLRSMKERADIIGADIDFINSPGDGLAITIKMPLELV
jgi:signal transduction histidine kinase